MREKKVAKLSSSLNTQTTGVDYMSKTIYTKDPAKRFYVYAFLREDGSLIISGKAQVTEPGAREDFVHPKILEYLFSSKI